MKNTFITKYTYLFRFLISLCLALYIPGLIFGFMLIHRSYTEIQQRNEAYYQKITLSFDAYFNEQLHILKNHSLTITLNNYKSNNEINKDIIESNPFYYLLATAALSKYKIGLPETVDIGLHFKGTDYIITSMYKYSMGDFLRVYSGPLQKQKDEMINFFNVDDNSTAIFSTFGYKNYEDARLFIGIPVTIENSNTLIFYMLKYNSISTSFFDTKSSEQLKLYIFDNFGSLIYTNSTSKLGCLNDKDFIEYITNPEKTIFKYRDNNINYTVFKVNNAYLGKTFVSIIPQDKIDESFQQFYNIMRNDSILIAIGFVFLLIITVYINYRPILKLVRGIITKYGNIGVDSELKIISHAFDQIEDHISEQKILFMDYLLGNLLNGISIPKTNLKQLGIDIYDGNFCVLVISDLKLDVVKQKQLSNYVLSVCQTQTYITDILYKKNHLVLICLPKEDDVSKLLQEVKQYLYLQYGISYKIGAGHMVHQIDDIHKSYMSALYSMEPLSANSYALNNEYFIIENYPSDDITIFLQYVQNGQTDNALKTLNSIVQYILDEISTIMIQRYICYDILIAYFKCLKKIEYPISKKEISDLLTYNNINDFYNSLSVSVKLVCENIVHNNDSIYNSLKKEVLSYINDHFIDPNICRVHVADHFGISIYSLSRLFKDSIGIGFTEYITAKRMELSRQLLLTTDKSIIQIASEIGFIDPDYFSKLFKAHYGLSASKFRSQKQS